MVRITPLSNYAKAGKKFVRGNRVEAKQAVSGHVLNRVGMPQMYEMMIESCKEEICSILKILASPNIQPVLFFCQHGKDRTGLIAMSVLSCLGVEEEALIYEYRLSEWRLFPISDLVHSDMVGVGLNEEFEGTPPDVMRRTLEFIRSRYGSVSQYLNSAGFGQVWQEQIRKVYLEEIED